MERPLSEQLSERSSNGLVVGVLPGFQFRVDHTVVEHHLESPTAGGDQGQAADVLLELTEQLFGHAHGTAGVASNDAVFDAEFHAGHASPVRV